MGGVSEKDPLRLGGAGDGPFRCKSQGSLPPYLVMASSFFPIVASNSHVMIEGYSDHQPSVLRNSSFLTLIQDYYYFAVFSSLDMR